MILKKSEAIAALRFSKKVIIGMFTSAAIFTVTMIVVYIVTGAVPDTLITEFFGFFKVEGGALGIIKVAEIIIDLFTKSKSKKKEGTKQNDQLENETDIEEVLGGADCNSDSAGGGAVPGQAPGRGG